MGRIKAYKEAVSNVRVAQLLERATTGETKEIRDKARNELLARNKALATRANRQLTYLERAGYDRWAYDRAISYIESEMKSLTKRFSGNEHDFNDLKDIAWNIREMSTFLRSKGSTVAGNREIDREILEFFRNQSTPVLDDEGNPVMNKKGNPVLKKIRIKKSEEKAFFDLLNSDAWEELKKTYYSSRDAIDMLIQVTNYNKKTTLDWAKLQEQLEKVRSGKLTMDIALEEFGYKI